MTLRQQTVIGLSIGFAVVQIMTALILARLSYTLTERDVRAYLTREAQDLVRTQFLITNQTLTFRQDSEGNTVTDRLRKRGFSVLVVNPDGTAKNVFGIYRTFITEGEDARGVAGIREVTERVSDGYSHLTLPTHEQFETYTFPLVSSGKTVGFVQVAREERSLSDMVSSSSLIMLALIPLSILFGVFLSLWIVRRALSPLERLTHAVRRIPDGVFPEHIPAISDTSPEYTILATVINRLLSSLTAIFARHKEFIGNVAHELRTPLTKAITAVDVMLMKDTSMSSASKSALQSIQDDLFGISASIDGLMSVSRLYEADQSGMMETDVSVLVTHIMNVHDDAISKKHIHIRVDAAHTEMLPMPPAIAMSLLGNIIGNAIKYSHDNGEILIRARSTKQEMHIEVSDAGIGMSDEVRQRIFDRRYRGTASSHGYGVGMALVRRIADMWHIGVTVQSHEGKGTTVMLAIKK